MSTIITWQPILHGHVIRGWEAQAPNGKAARMLLEQQMRDAGYYSLLREWQRATQGIGVVAPKEGTPDGVVPGGLP